MADQDERIVLEIDDRPAKAATDRANKGLDDYEKKGEQAADKVAKAFAASGETIVRTTDRTRSSVERLVAAAEKKANFAGLDKVGSLQAERQQTLNRIGGGDAAAVERVNTAYSKMIDLQKEADRVAAQTRGIKESTAALEAHANAVRRNASDLAQMATRINGLGVQLTAGLTLPLVGAATAALAMSERMAKARVAFTTFLGSEDKANTFISQLKDFALATPFEFKELIPAAQRMKAFGFEAKEIIPVLKAIGDATAGMAAGQEVMDRIALALGQIRQKGKVSAEEMRQLAEAGIPAWEILAKKIGVSIPEAMEMAKKGAISADQALPAILAGMAGKFGGLMAKQNQLLSGQFSNLKDQLGFLLADIGKVLTPLAGAVVSFGATAVGWLRKVVEAFQVIPKPIQTVVIGVVTLTALLGPATLAVGQLTKAFALLYGLNNASAVGSLATGIKDVFTYATGGTTVMTQLGSKLLFVAKGAGIAAAAFAGWEIGRWIRDWTGLGDAIDSVWEKLGVAARITKEETRAQQDQEFASQKLYESLKKRGVAIERNGRSLEDWNRELKLTANQMSVFDEMAKKGNGTTKESTEAKTAEARAHQLLVQAQKNEYKGLADIIQEYRIYQQEIGITVKARKDLAAALEINLRKGAQKEAKSALEVSKKQMQEEHDLRATFDTAQSKKVRDFQDETARLDIEATKEKFAYEEELASQNRDAQIRGIEALNARTTEQKLQVEAMKLKVEEEYVVKSATLKTEALDREVEAEVKAMEAIARAQGVTEVDITARREAIYQGYYEKTRQIQLKGDSDLAKAREEAGIKSGQIIVDANQKAFDRVRSAFESILDQMLGRARSWGDVMKSILNAALLTPIKQFASAFFASLVTGQQVAMGPGGQATVTGRGGGGLLGGLGGLFGMGGFGLPGVGGAVPGGTPPFLPGASGVPGAATSGGGGLKGFGGLLGGFAGGGNPFFNSGSINMGGYSTTAAGLGGIKGGLAGFGSSSAAPFIGAGLAADGLRRGGFLGLGETTAGGALIGFKFGGPVGAAIGAGIGAVAGTIRLFFKGATDKVISKVKSAYGVTLDKERGQQIAAIAKQGFGGDLDQAIRSDQVKDLIELYAMSTGQKWRNDKGTPVAASLAQSQGTLFQLPTYFNGSAVTASGGSIPSIASSGAPNITVVAQVQIPGDKVADVMEGRAVNAISANPRVVQAAVTSANKSNVGRRETSVLQMAPGLLTS